MIPDDLAFIVEARRRAAVSAKFGSREAKSGTFGDLLHVKRYCERVLRDAQAAFEPWAQWEAINDLLASKENREALNDYKAFSDMRISFYKEALLAAARVTDPVRHKRHEIHSAPTEELKYSLLGLAKVLDDADLRDKLCSRQWALDLGYAPVIVDSAATENTN